MLPHSVVQCLLSITRVCSCSRCHVYPNYIDVNNNRPSLVYSLFCPVRLPISPLSQLSCLVELATKALNETADERTLDGHTLLVAADDPVAVAAGAGGADD